MFLGWDRLAHRISVKLSVHDYNDPGSPGNTLVGNYCYFFGGVRNRNLMVSSLSILLLVDYHHDSIEFLWSKWILDRSGGVVERS